MALPQHVFYSIARGVRSGQFVVSDIGDFIPASLMLHDLENRQPVGCSYMNRWGCAHLGSSAEEVNDLGDAYYSRYFLREEMQDIFRGIGAYLAAGDFEGQHNFFQRVKLYGDRDYSWFYTVSKLIQVQTDDGLADKLVLLSSPVSGMDDLVKRVNRTLELDSYIRQNYRAFAKLTKREKEIITLLANGKSTKEIAEIFFISIHTVSTHRKNLLQKIDCKSFAELLRFAVAFDLV